MKSAKQADAILSAMDIINKLNAENATLRAEIEKLQHELYLANFRKGLGDVARKIQGGVEWIES